MVNVMSASQNISPLVAERILLHNCKNKFRSLRKIRVGYVQRSAQWFAKQCTLNCDTGVIQKPFEVKLSADFNWLCLLQLKEKQLQYEDEVLLMRDQLSGAQRCSSNMYPGFISSLIISTTTTFTITTSTVSVFVITSIVIIIVIIVYICAAVTIIMIIIISTSSIPSPA